MSVVTVAAAIPPRRNGRRARRSCATLPAEDTWQKESITAGTGVPIRTGVIGVTVIRTGVIVGTLSCSWGIAVITGAAIRA
jgi:hypothetical protein